MTSKALWAVIVVILAPAVVVPLLVGLYDRTDPTFLGFPFYYWFQFLLILASTALTGAAYALSLLADRRRKEEQR